MIMEAAVKLKEEGILATVISMPSFKLLEESGEEYIMELFPHGVPKIALEAGATMGWWKYVGRDGIVIGLDRFGASASAPLVQNKLGISADHVIEAAKKLGKEVAVKEAGFGPPPYVHSSEIQDGYQRTRDGKENRRNLRSN